MAISLVPTPRVGRVLRRPQHRWYIETVPFAIQPMVIAPVIPGETLKSALFQARVITDPIKNPIMGWWTEYYWFYVKLRDLHGREDFTEMLVNLDKDLSAYETGANASTNHNSGIDWAHLCLQCVVENYFRDEGEAWDAYTHEGMPLAAVNMEMWTNSAGLDEVYKREDLDVDLDEDGTITAAEVEGAMRTWQFMYANGLTEMDYEDYLRTFGIRVDSEEEHKPELLRYVREWTYPANTVGTSGDEFGVPATAVSWAIADRMDKDRFFKEPGFICGYSVTRPKVYVSNVRGNLVDHMTDALSWLPAILKDDPWTSLKKFAQGTGPLPTVSDADGYWVDMKDLLIYGDQFTNTGVDYSGVQNAVDLPADDLVNRWYPDGTSIDAMFVGDANKVRQDGVVNFNILGAQVDTTPQGEK